MPRLVAPAAIDTADAGRRTPGSRAVFSALFPRSVFSALTAGSRPRMHL
jgi:hypothetical protein